MREFHVLSLGAGWQSTALYLMAMDGEIPVRFDCAVFADTQAEPRAVYEHLAWLEAQGRFRHLMSDEASLVALQAWVDANWERLKARAATVR